MYGGFDGGRSRGWRSRVRSVALGLLLVAVSVAAAAVTLKERAAHDASLAISPTPTSAQGGTPSATSSPTSQPSPAPVATVAPSTSTPVPTPTPAARTPDATSPPAPKPCQPRDFTFTALAPAARSTSWEAWTVVKSSPGTCWAGGWLATLYVVDSHRAAAPGYPMQDGGCCGPGGAFAWTQGYRVPGPSGNGPPTTPGTYSFWVSCAMFGTTATTQFVVS